MRLFFQKIRSLGLIGGGVVTLFGLTVWSGVITIGGMAGFNIGNLSPFGALETTAATTSAVAATVSAANVSMQITTGGTVTYGTMNLNSTKSTTASELNSSQTINNNGNVTENFNVKGENSAAWTLAAAAGSEQYVHKFSATGAVPYTWTALTTSYQTMASSITSTGATTKPLDLQITTPSSTATYTSQNVNVDVQAVCTSC